MDKFSLTLLKALRLSDAKNTLQLASLLVAMSGLLLSSACYGQSSSEENTVLLSINGDLIGANQNLPKTTAPEVLIEIYYEEPATDIANQLSQLFTNMNRRTEDYQVAFRSGDTAEINETLDDLSFYWASIRTLHAQEFSREAIEILESAYAKIFPFIREVN